jgi:hypothetical protein
MVVDWTRPDRWNDVVQWLKCKQKTFNEEKKNTYDLFVDFDDNDVV